MIGFGASLIPAAGHAGLSSVVPFMIGSIFNNSGVSIDMTKIVNSLPSVDKIRKCVTENAIDTILLMQDSLKQNCHFISLQKKGK